MFQFHDGNLKITSGPLNLFIWYVFQSNMMKFSSLVWAVGGGYCTIAHLFFQFPAFLLSVVSSRRSRVGGLESAVSRLWSRGCDLEAVVSRLWSWGCGLEVVGTRLWSQGCGLEAVVSRLSSQDCCPKTVVPNPLSWVQGDFLHFIGQSTTCLERPHSRERTFKLNVKPWSEFWYPLWKSWKC